MSGSTSEDSGRGGKGGSSSSSSSDSHGEGERVVMDPEATASSSGPEGEEDNNSGYADPESPNSKADSSSSSEGVLVELPAGADQDSRGLQGDHDGGILVNIDGSMLEQAEEGSRRGEDLGREEMFVDAPDQLGFVEGRRPVGLEESMAVIEIGENTRERCLVDEVARLRAQLDERVAECRRYKEEHQLFSSEIVNLRYQLRAMADQQSLVASGDAEGVSGYLHPAEIRENSSDDRNLMASLPLHNVVGECSELASHLRSSMDELVQSEATIKELNGVLNSKYQEIEDLNMKLSEYSVSHDVIASYLNSVKNVQFDALKESSDAAVQRLLVSLSSVVQDSETPEGSDDEKIYVVEEKTKLLIEKYTIFMHEIKQLGQCLGAARSDFTIPPVEQFGLVFEAVRGQLLESTTKESHILGKINELEQEKSEVLEELNRTKESLEMSKSEVNKTSMELEQAENRFLTVKEKLSIAVTKGKSLVQQRDSLKQSLAEKTSELEKCLQELQQKYVALEAAEGINEELRDAVQSYEAAISMRENTLNIIERDISEIDIPEELQAADITGRISYLVSQIKVSEGTMMENSRIRDALSSFNLPEPVSYLMLEYQIDWLGTSFSKAREDATKLENELTNVQAALGSCESQLSEAHKEIKNLTESLFVEKQGKDSLQVLYEEMTSKYEGVTGRLSQVSSEKNHLVRALGEIAESNVEDDTSGDINAFKDKCIEIIKERVNASTATSSATMEELQRMQSLLYVRSLELILCEKMLEEEMVSQSERMATLEELHKSSSEVLALRNERDTLQKDLERSEERSSLLREKLSMAVKKGKGLVQEREGLKHSVDEKNSEIENLKQELKSQESAMIEYKEHIRILTSDLEQSQKLESATKDERDQIERILLESNSTLQKVIGSMEQIVLPSYVTITNPIERLNSIAQYIHESEVVKVHVEQELDKLKEEAIMQGNKLVNANATIKSLEDTLIEKDKQISIILEEKKNSQVGKDSAELEMEKLKEETHTLSGELKQAYETLKALKDALEKSEDRISLLMDEKFESESKSKLAIASLNTKIAACMEELAGTHDNLEDQSAEVASHLRQFQLLAKDESLPSLMTEVFNKNIGALRKMIPLIEDISSQIYSEESQVHSGSKLENFPPRLLSLPPLGDYVDDRVLPPDTSMSGSMESMPSFTEVATELNARTIFFRERLEQFSSYLNENITFLLQILETTRVEVIRLVEHKESLKLKVNNLNALMNAQEIETSKLQNDMKILLSACSDSIQDLQIDLLEVMDTDTDSQQTMSLRLESEFNDVLGGGNFVSESENIAQKLLVAVRRVKGQIEHLPSVKSSWTGTIVDLKNKLIEAELVADSAKEDRDIHRRRVDNLERELHLLQTFCNEMKSNIDDYQAKEIVWKDKEDELLSLQHHLAVKDREEDKGLLLDGQLEYLLGQVNEIEIPFKELESRGTEQQLSRPVDKIFYIINGVATLQQMLHLAIVERDNLQSIVSFHVDEVEQLKEIVKNFSGSREKLEQKTKDLNDLTGTLERIVQKLGGNGSLEEKKTLDARGLLSLLERLILSSTEECESFKLRAQEFGAKLLVNQKVVDELSAKVKSLEDSIQTQSTLPETKERSVFEASTSKTGSEISEIEDVGSLGKKSASPVLAAAHARTMRKGSSDHLALNVDMESDRLISSYESDDKGHFFKSLNSSGLVPKQGKVIADRIDSIWVSGGRLLMGRPEARMGLIAYSILLHLWVLVTIL